MRATTSAILTVALAAASADATPLHLNERATPTLYLAGDSTMAKLSAPTDGTYPPPHAPPPAIQPSLLTSRQAGANTSPNTSPSRS